jgi:NitT/TauT family transport system ATP-binding protein
MVSRAGVPIVLRNVSKVFGADGDRPFPALRQISVSIAPGEFISVVAGSAGS